jgi:hypothetical protein
MQTSTGACGKRAKSSSRENASAFPAVPGARSRNESTSSGPESPDPKRVTGANNLLPLLAAAAAAAATAPVPVPMAVAAPTPVPDCRGFEHDKAFYDYCMPVLWRHVYEFKGDAWRSLQCGGPIVTGPLAVPRCAACKAIRKNYERERKKFLASYVKTPGKKNVSTNRAEI